MDDYLLDVLKEQQERETKGTGNAVQEQLERLGISEKLATVQTSHVDTPEKNMGQKDGIRVLKGLEQALHMAEVVRDNGASGRQTERGTNFEVKMAGEMGRRGNEEWNQVGSGKGYLERGAERDGWTEPETLSMFFQRDARRYS